MKKKTRTVITFETWQTKVFRQMSRPLLIHCDLCMAETEMFLPAELARKNGSTLRQVFRGIETGVFHFIETPDGCVLVCSNSSTHQIKGE